MERAKTLCIIWSVSIIPCILMGAIIANYLKV